MVSGFWFLVTANSQSLSFVMKLFSDETIKQ